MIFVRCIPHYYCLLQSRCKGHFETVDWSIQLKHWQDKHLAFQVDLWMQSLADPWMHTQCHGIILLCMLSPPQGGCYIYCILCNLNYCRPCNRSKCLYYTSPSACLYSCVHVGFPQPDKEADEHTQGVQNCYSYQIPFTQLS